MREPQIRRLSKEELAALNTRLRTWMTVDELDRILRSVDETAGFYTVSQGGLKIWRESFVAISCAMLSHAQRVRLGADPPDFELCYGDHTRCFEIVDILPAGRKLGQTYDDFADLLNASEGIPLESLNMEAEYNALPGDFARQLAAKVAKGYDPAPILVADIHHSIIPETDYTMLMGLARLARPALTSFPEIWLRNGAHLVRVSRFGETQIAPVKPEAK